MLSRLRASALAILAAIALAHPAYAARLPQLIDQNGHAFTFQNLRGTPLIVTFVAAHCTDACPLINAQFSQASHRFTRLRAHVRLLTITLDPEHDSLRDMRDIARRFNADPQRWIVAGGSRRNVHAIMSAFGVTTQRGPDGYADMHTTFVYYIDDRGTLRKTLLASTALTEQLVDLVK